MKTYYNETDEAGISELLFGRKIIKAHDGVLTLDNGTELIVTANEGCGGCASGWYSIEALNTCDNAITSVELVCEESADGGSSYKIFVLAEDKRINVLQVDGDDGNGYYGTGYSIEVRFAKKDGLLR